MKKLAFILLLFFVQITWAQSVADIFNYKAITFYGLDFSQSKCVGEADFPGGQEIVDTYIPKWNYFLMESKRRIKIGAPYKKKNIEYDTLVYAYNRAIPIHEFVVNEANSFKKSQIEGFVKKYSDRTKYGIGLVYLVETLNASDEYASIWITFFDISTGKVLLSEPSRAEGKGKDFEEYWMLAFLKIYDNSADEYKSWEKIYQ